MCVFLFALIVIPKHSLCLEEHSPNNHPDYISKCCPVNEIFNKELASCQGLTESVFYDFESILNGYNISVDVILFNRILQEMNITNDPAKDLPYHSKVPICNKREVLISYQMTTEKLLLRHKWIIPKTTRKGRKFCVDSITSQNNFYSGDLSSLTWIVRVCRPVSVCDEIPCIRKCCAFNEMLAKIENNTICIPYEKDLNITFHDVTSSGNPVIAPTPGKF